MSLSSDISTTSTALSDIKTAIIAKGVTPSGNITTYATAISQISGGSSPVISSLSITPTTSQQTITAPSGTDGYSPITVSAVTNSIDANITAGNIKKDVSILGVTGTYEGSGGGGGSGTTDVPLTRFKDDTNTEIGTHYCNFIDSNGNTYKVILLDAQYRNSSTKWCSETSSSVTNMPLYTDLKNSNVWQAGETATTNTQLILDYCTAHSYNSYTSTACSHCRSKSFIINGTTYYGQLPNTIEVINLAKHYNQFDALDTSASSQSSLNFSSARNIWSSNQRSMNSGWNIGTSGNAGSNSKTSNYFACPVLEIPA